MMVDIDMISCLATWQLLAVLLVQQKKKSCSTVQQCTFGNDIDITKMIPNFFFSPPLKIGNRFRLDEVPQ